MNKRLHAPYAALGRRRSYVITIALLVLAIGVTWGARAWQVAKVRGAAELHQQAVVAEAQAYVQAELVAMQRDLMDQATALAQNAQIRQALRRRALEGERSTAAFIRLFADVDLPQRWSVELYDSALELLAWNGISLPLDEAALRGLTSVQWAIAEDSDWRQALVVWHPVKDGTRVLGTVRVMQLVNARAPVYNEYLQDYHVSDRWSQRLQVSVRAMFSPSQSLQDSTEAMELRALDGVLLGRAEVELPPAGSLVELTKQRYENVLAFWAMLLLLWWLFGLWIWTRSGAARPGVRLVAFGALWWVGRYALLWLDAPARWQSGIAGANALFDPSHLASALGGGLLRSSGDFLITALFSLALALVVLGYAARSHRPFGEHPASYRDLWLRCVHTRSRARLFGGLLLTVAVALGVVVLLATITRHSVLDSTLDYFARDVLFPPTIILVVFCALIMTALSALLFVASLLWITLGFATKAEGQREFAAAGSMWPWALALLGAIFVAVWVAEACGWVPWPVGVAFLGVGFAMAWHGLARPGGGLRWLMLRSVLPGTFVVSMLVYPLFFSGLDERRRHRMEYAAESFAQGHDPGAVFAVRDVLMESRSEPRVASLLRAGDRAALDALALELLRGPLVSSLGSYDVSLVFLDDAGAPQGRYDIGEEISARAARDQATAQQFGMLRQMHQDRRSDDILVEEMAGRRDPDRFQYVGVAPVAAPGTRAALGWILARAEPHVIPEEASTPLLRALLSSGYSDLYARLSLADFNEGILVRSIGRSFRRYRLDEAAARGLVAQPEQWRHEVLQTRRYQTYYKRERTDDAASRVVAVRVAAVSTFDHLYYLLRLTVAGLLVGLLFYLAGLYLRRKANLLPAPRVHFRDKVLNAFLIVGIISVVTVGIVGVQVVTEENDRAVRSWLRQHLQRVEETLSQEAEGDEMTYHVLARSNIDSLAARVSLDLNLYQDGRLVASSRGQLIQDRLIDIRLPIQAYETLNLDGYKFTFVEANLGALTYTAGYRALLDEKGMPRYVLSVPTLPEQERIEEERARTLAYLFGALLALVVLVMFTASILANALARPIARLQQGLQAVAKGRFERMLPVRTRDEVGELVETFNEMQGQLAESRRQLAQQERQLAWREMARQVAHEIKNPLTPMKLSLQHLRRAFDERQHEAQAKFKDLFDRITLTLVEQIDSMAHIANEFATFARMPAARMVERLDLCVVVREAVSLMQEEADAHITIALQLPSEPLVVEADRKEMGRIYINLIKNALEALRDDESGQVTIMARREAPEGFAYSTVVDTGPGIPEAVQEKIFEPSFSTKTSGAGLGLAIARRSIEAMGGEIGFETRSGGGTTIWTRLPLA